MNEYLRRMYVSAQEVAAAVNPGLPSFTTPRAVYWADDRQAFCVVLSMPPEEQYLVPQGDIIPVLEPTDAEDT